MVVSILSTIYSGGNRSAGAIVPAVEDLVSSLAWCNTKKKVTLSGKRCPARGVMVMCYCCWAMPMVFGSTLIFDLAGSRFFFFAFFQAPLRHYI